MMLQSVAGVLKRALSVFETPRVEGEVVATDAFFLESTGLTHVQKLFHAVVPSTFR